MVQVTVPYDLAWTPLVFIVTCSIRTICYYDIVLSYYLDLCWILGSTSTLEDETECSCSIFQVGPHAVSPPTWPIYSLRSKSVCFSMCGTGNAINKVGSSSSSFLISLAQNSGFHHVRRWVEFTNSSHWVMVGNQILGEMISAFHTIVKKINHVWQIINIQWFWSREILIFRIFRSLQNPHFCGFVYQNQNFSAICIDMHQYWCGIFS